MQQVKNVIDSIISLQLKPLLKDEGYRKASRTFRYFGNNFVKVVNVQASSWNSSEDGKFTINLGVYFPKLAEVHDYLDVSDKPTESECLVSTRIGLLMPTKEDFWWSVDKESSISKLSQELSDSWLRYGKPWIDKHSDLFEARKFYLDNFYFPYIVAMMSVVLGDMKMATQMATKTVADHPEMYERVSKWASKNNIKLKKAG